jgi:nitrogen fixation NifU-like protein
VNLEGLYQQIILDHNKKKAGYGLTPGGQVSHQYNPTCGDEIELKVLLSDDGSTITGVEWEGKGCSISQASASLMAQEIAGMTLAEFETFAGGFREAMRSRGEITLDEEEFGDTAALSGVSKFVARVKCAMLAWVAAEDSVARTRDLLN